MRCPLHFNLKGLSVINPKCFIVGGGPSLRGFDFNRLKTVDTIAINQSIFHVPNPNYFITMDYLYVKNNPQIFDIKTHKIFIANHCVDYIQEINGKITDTRSGLVYELDKFDEVIDSWYPVGMGDYYGHFVHGGNSGFCALQLAVLRGYTEIYLLGIDLVTEKAKTHFHDAYCLPMGFGDKLRSYEQAFVAGLSVLNCDMPDVKVYSCSPISTLNEKIPYKSIEEALS